MVLFICKDVDIYFILKKCLDFGPMTIFGLRKFDVGFNHI